MNAFSADLFRVMPIVAILRGTDPNRLEPLVAALQAGGLTTLEITMNTPDAADQIQRVVRASRGSLNIGAGTVTSLDLLGRALRAGASFIVTPVVATAVIKECSRLGIPVFPGALTPSEVVNAWELGAQIVKIFPADRPGYLRRLNEILPEVGLFPTGGVDLDRLPALLEAGAIGAGVGSPLLRKSWIEAGDWLAIERQCRAFADVYRRHAAAGGGGRPNKPVSRGAAG
jgi:2-dehydro-3-deoxyphosphogluconate aldolase/(4S)-4-hydroxy-2-oxoglutarate aldolase